MCLVLGSIACTPPVDPDLYEGSCPILIECSAEVDQTLAADYLNWYGEQGTCWAIGSNNWGECRDSCNRAIDSLNIQALAQGQATCGTCARDSDCAEFDAARCIDGYCNRRRLGDVGESGLETTTGTDTGDDTTTDEADGTIDPVCLGQDMADDTPTVVLDTSLGVLVVELDALAAPEAVQSFLLHVSADYYDGSIIHRVVPQVVIQGGNYAPGPAQLSSPYEPIELVTVPTLAHQPGVIALLPSFDGSSVGAQWYITAGPTPPAAAPSGIVFGALANGSSGQAVLDAISNTPVTTVPWLDFELHDIPEQDVVVNEVYCVEQWP